MRLEHENIVPILDAGEADGECFLVMELLKGESLHDRLKREHRLPLKESLRIAREIAAGLIFVHAHGLCHRDVCPMNVWLEPSGRARLRGFGESCSTEADPLLSRLDGVGTAGYLSPEQAAGEAIAPASDLFSLGCVLYQMLTGERPFRGENSAALFRAVVFEYPTSVRQINPEIPEALDDLVVRLDGQDASRPSRFRPGGRTPVDGVARSDRTETSFGESRRVAKLPGVEANSRGDGILEEPGFGFGEQQILFADSVRRGDAAKA